MKTTKLLILLALLVHTVASAQFFYNVPGTKPYHGTLNKIDALASLEPNKALDLIQELRKKGTKADNNHLLATLDIYEASINYYHGKSDTAIVIFNQSIEKAEKLKCQPLRSTASIRKLLVLLESNQAKPILTLMNDEYAVAKSNNDTLNIIYALNGKAMCLSEIGDKKGSVEAYIEAIDLAKKSKNSREQGLLLNNLGLLKLNLRSPKEAIKDFRSALKLAKKTKDLRLELTIRENFGVYYHMIDSIDLAIQSYSETFKIASEKHFAYHILTSLVNLGSMEHSLGHNAKGDSLLSIALQTAHKEKLYETIPAIYLTLAQIERDCKDFKTALRDLDSAMTYAKYADHDEIKEGVLLISHQVYEQMEEFDLALDLYKEYIKLKDSIDKNGQLQIITELQLKYNLEKKEKEHEQVMREYDADSATMKRNFALIGIAILLIIGLLIIYYFINKSKREAEFSAALVNKLEEEKGRIARDLHDGIGQSLVILKNKVHNLKSDNKDDVEQLDQAFDETIEEVRSISRSLIPPELKRLGLRKAIAKMIKDIEESTGIIATADTDALEELSIDESSNIRIYRIIQELTNNSIKHAEATSIRIVFQHVLGRLVITYQDNGRGISNSEVNDSNSVGMKSISQRLKYLNGTIKIEKPERGFKAIIKLRLNN